MDQKPDIDRLIHQEFPQRDGLVYLNHAGISPWPQRCARAVQQFAQENVHPGAHSHSAWLQTEQQLRRQLQNLINAPSSAEIALLKNTSEALSFVASGLCWREHENIVSSDQEFPSNRLPWDALQREGLVQLREVNLDQGLSPEDALMAACDRHTRLLTISAVQYASGLRIDLRRLGAFCKSRGILFCVDAIQQLGALPLDVQEIQADFLMADGHKWMLSAEGIALFYCAAQCQQELQLSEYGWHMVQHAGDFSRRDWQPAEDARRFECGSPNMLGIHALHASLSLIEEVGLPQMAQRIIRNTSYLIEQIHSCAGFDLLTPAAIPRRAGIVTFRVRDLDLVALQHFLAEQGVICATRNGGLRFSPHFYNRLEQLEHALALVRDYAETARS